jgi:hypothetical protein
LSPISAALIGYDLIIGYRKESGVPMQDMTAELAKKSGPMRAEDRLISSESRQLDQCYGQIGISAVAAAVRYQGGAKNPAYAPCSNKWRDLIADVAA